MKFINPKTDFAFKKIFGSTASKEILKSFLNALIYDGIPRIEDLEIIDPYLSSKVSVLKDSYLDVKAKITGGKTIIIEMQVLNVSSFAKRVIYNAAKAYSTQLGRGEGYSKLKPVIALTITDFDLFEGEDSVISHFVFKEKERLFDYPDAELELVFVELPKFKTSLEELETLTDKWIYFMKNAPSLETVPEKMGDVSEIKLAFGIANEANLSLEELEDLEKREMFIEDQRGLLTKGLQQGREEGLAEGMKQKAIDIAKQLIGKLDHETISQTTGLSLEEIQGLHQQ
ncbi:MAG: Rpn family recombination-promoting nuclease/putative transposase [Microcoleaceae cyanobacterium]